MDWTNFLTQNIIPADFNKYDLNKLEDVDKFIGDINELKNFYTKECENNEMFKCCSTLFKPYYNIEDELDYILKQLNARRETLVSTQHEDDSVQLEDVCNEDCDNCEYRDECDCDDIYDEMFVEGKDVTLDLVKDAITKKFDNINEKTVNSLCEKIVDYLNAETNVYSKLMTDEEFESIVNNLLDFSAFILKG